MGKKSNNFQAPTQRQLRVGEVIRRALSEILQRGDLHDADLSKTSITVGEVRLSADLKLQRFMLCRLVGRMLALLFKHWRGIRVN